MSDTPQHDGRRARLLVTLVAVVLGCGGVAALLVGVTRQQPAPPSPPPASAAAPQDTAAAEPRDEGASPSGAGAVVPLLDYAEPTVVRIPRIGVESRLVDLGLDEAGVMETPVPVEVAGWFTPSPPPGVGGTTVIAGHVTWDQEPTVFFRLGDLREGDAVVVGRDDGAEVRYVVTRIGSFPKESFPTEDVYDQTGRSELRLITCGGEYDEGSNEYLDNVIVWARAVGVDR